MRPPVLMKRSSAILFILAICSCSGTRFATTSSGQGQEFDVRSYKIREAPIRTRGHLSYDAKTEVLQIQPECGKLIHASIKLDNPSFKSGTSYDVDLLECSTIGHPDHPHRFIAIRIHEGEKLVHDSSVCDTHKASMARTVEVPVGAPGFPSNSKNNKNDGYFRAHDDPSLRHVVWVCPTCKKNTDRRITGKP
ncbi:hypothetical protein OKA04_12965 [Luteolibacter flavescens]|uniref:Secreted protein n=1 Tax=Luteolibacter flavescens TaxID=1859460 RepID=A0ABT3FPX9_9BACT|nr:hypothetical protein [Luteolibacter flavescens]